MSGQIVYLDASALAKFFLDEAGQAELAAYLADRPARATSRVSIVEVSRAIARVTGASPEGVDDLLSRAAIIELGPTVSTRASTLPPPALRSLDAIHLASAMELGDDLGALVTYDQRLADAARSLCLRVVSPGLEPAA